MIRKPILTNKSYLLPLRLQLFESLIASKLWFGSGTWGSLTFRQTSKLNSATAKMIRIIVCEAKGPQTNRTDEDIRAEFGLLDARSRVGRDRLLYANHLYRHGPGFLHNLLEKEAAKDPTSWLHSLKADLDWLQTLTPNDNRWPRDFHELVQFWKEGGPQWKAIVNHAIKVHIAQESTALEVKQWHFRCYNTFKWEVLVLMVTPWQRKLRPLW